MPEANELTIGIMAVVAQADRKMTRSEPRKRSRLRERDAFALEASVAVPRRLRTASLRPAPLSPRQTLGLKTWRPSSPVSSLTVRCRSTPSLAASMLKACRPRAAALAGLPQASRA
jgi:hypothetical protein